MSYPKLVLASTSPFRKILLEKLHLPFETAAPDIDESQLDDETPREMVERLAVRKAKKVAESFPEALIIGSDQVACADTGFLGKPGNRENAIAQLEKLSGKKVVFYTSLCLLNAKTGQQQLTTDPFVVHFRNLDKQQIVNYVDIEEPYHCAGSFKSEALGITLFSRLRGKDPNSLVGLPLIALTDMLANEGFTLPISG